MTERALRPVEYAKSLQALNPDVARQWHPTLNGGLTPSDFTQFSTARAFWVCTDDERHVWNSKISARSVAPGCPVCRGKVVISGVNDLGSSAEHALIVAEWHPDNAITPQEVTVRSNKSVAWVCSNDDSHTWTAKIANRTALGSGCPVCSVKKRSGARQMSRTVANDPILSVEWSAVNDCDSASVTLGSGLVAHWVCRVDSSHTWDASVVNRSKGSGCPCCSGRTVDIEAKNLLALFPEIASQLHPDARIDPATLNSNSHLDVPWQCSVNPKHSWLSSPRTRTVLGTGCPHCLNRTRREPLSDHAALVAQWGPSNEKSPDEYSAGSQYIAEWVCSADEHHAPWRAAIVDRTRGRGCPSCAAENFASSQEREIADVLTALGVTFLSSVRGQIRHGLELDLFLPELNFAIEFNGVYWHSDRFKKRNYHQAKYLACKRAGIALYQVWEDDWNERRDVVIRDLAARLGKTAELAKALPSVDRMLTEQTDAATDAFVVNSIAMEAARDFLEAHHVKGFSRGSNYVGLFDMQGRLRAVASLLRTMTPEQRGDVIITRYATAGGVLGGLGAILAWMEPRIPMKRWVGFADLGFEDGSVYVLGGFEANGDPTPLDFSYVIGSQRVHKVNFTRERFKSDPDLLWVEGATERELAKLNSMLRVWDTGRVRYVRDVLSTQ